MRKIYAILSLTILMLNAQAQDTITKKRNPIKVSAGFMFAPQGGISLKDSRKGFETYLPLFATVTLNKGNLYVTPFYSITSNSIGAAVEYDAPKWGVYGVGTKNVITPNGYAGIGFETPVFNGKAAAFVEFGSIMGKYKYNPYLYTGVFIPLTFKIK